MTIYEFTEWRFRLGLSREATAELLGVHKDIVASWELGNSPIEKHTQLATLACELAYIAADQYVKANPSTLNNIGHKNYAEHHGRRHIRDGIINGRNPIKRELLILLAPKSLIHCEGKRS
jgi:transcriptional regulator with XRE-family HTH domain